MLQIPCDIGLVERVPCDGEVRGLIPSKVTPKNATSRGPQARVLRTDSLKRRVGPGSCLQALFVFIFPPE